MAVFLGLAVAASYGAADFCGGLASKRAAPWSVVLGAQYVGFAGIALLLLIDGTPAPAAGDLVLGAIASCIGVLGVGLLYFGLARGPMGVVAPITAVGSAIVPVVWGLATGERPGVAGLVGVVVALVAVVLISHTRGGDDDSTGPDDSTRPARLTLIASVAAGLAFGTFFVVLSHTGDDSGFWPIFSGRLASTTALLLVLTLLGRPRLPRGAAPGVVVLAGLFDVAANALFLLAAREGLLSLVSVLASLYPATTVILASTVLDERLQRQQLVGLGAALGGVALITGG
ncbi:MAG: EamA family transporter [Acidimicrobiia bacterium]